MKKLFLTSSVSYVAHDIAKRLDLKVHNKLVFITTAAEPKTGDKTWLNNDRQSLVDAGFDVTDYTITGKKEEYIKSDLKDYDFIYVSGGDTWYLLNESKKSGFFTLIKDFIYKEGKTYIGTSAGSIITGPKCPDYLLPEDQTLDMEKQIACEFTNFIILPHWGSDAFRNKYLNTRLEIAYKTNQFPLIALTDNQYIIIEDNRYEFIDVSK